MRKFIPNLLVVCGSGRKVGKTTVVRELINHFNGNNNSDNFKIAAIKVSPHFHDDKQPLNKIFQEDNCNVYIENKINSKDSSLFLQAGANPVYYVETNDNNISKAFYFILNHVPNGSLMICESGILGRIFKPGILIFLESEVNNVQDNDKITNRNIADIIVTVGENNLQKEVNNLKQKIKVVKSKWELV